VTFDTDQQSKRSSSGYAFERKIFAELKKSISNSLKKKGCILVYGREPKFKEKYPEIWRSLSIRTPIGSCTGDTDIILFDDRRKEPFAIISCKTSLRERITESLYYMRFYKGCYRRFLLFVVTEDKGYILKGKWKSELGTNSKPTKTRVLADKEGVSVYSTNPNTIFGGCVKPRTQLESDILDYV
jgi:hypothetical protein